MYGVDFIWAPLWRNGNRQSHHFGFIGFDMLQFYLIQLVDMTETSSPKFDIFSEGWMH